MVLKIVRGAAIGIFLGLVLGVALSGGMYLNKIIERNNQSIMAADEQAAAVFNSDDYADMTVPELYTDIAGATDAIYDVNENPPECTDLQDVILRFHVRANSNRDEDIAIKYAVRDAVLTELGGELKGDKTRDEVLIYLSDNLDRIEEIALKAIRDCGYGYTVKVYISNDYFPIRQYGEMVIPAGVYQALRIDIGLAEGENFWCLLYPMMCYTVDSGAVVSKEAGEKLAERLTEDEYRKLFIERDVKDDEVEVRFKLLELFGL